MTTGYNSNIKQNIKKIKVVLCIFIYKNIYIYLIYNYYQFLIIFPEILMCLHRNIPL